MDKRTETLLVEAEAVAVLAEKAETVDNDEELALAIGHAYLLSRTIGGLEKRRTETNSASQKKIREHTTWFKPMITRLDSQKTILRTLIKNWLAPNDDIGNQSVEDIRAYGSAGCGNAALSEVVELKIDLKKLVAAHPDLVQPDTTAIKKRLLLGETIAGVSSKKSYQLRIT